MLIKLLLGLVILYLFFKTRQAWKKTPPKNRKPLIIKIVIGVVILAVLVGVATGRMHPVSALVAALVPLARFGFGAATRLLPLWMHRTGGVASFKTEYLSVRFHMQQMRIEGSVIKGPYEGKNLQDLSDEALDELIAFYESKDTRSCYLIKVFRKQGGAQQQNFQDQKPPTFGDPARDEALEILGLSGDPSKEEITQAHRKLINKLHPDRGGSEFLASRVNQARDVLMQKFK